MTDRELLELAAKAAGLTIDKSDYTGGGYGNGGFDMLGNVVLDWHNNKTWNPLTDDGDAARLEAKLRLDVTWFSDRVRVKQWPNKAITEFYAEHDCDRTKARRYAAVKAAAEIAKRAIQPLEPDEETT